jgi:hypothetical protein
VARDVRLDGGGEFPVGDCLPTALVDLRSRASLGEAGGNTFVWIRRPEAVLVTGLPAIDVDDEPLTTGHRPATTGNQPRATGPEK